MMKIAFDESGNTGANLFDADQYVFTLASTCIDDTEADRLLRTFDGKIQGEYKYAKLKKASRNHPLILNLLRDDSINGETCQVYAIHKAFMAVSKIVDNIYEPLAHEGGLDLYENKAALATANLLCTVLPCFLGVTRYHRLLSRFNELARNKDDVSFNAFHKEVISGYEHLLRNHGDSTDIFASLVVACERGLGFFKQHIMDFDHDPWVPALYVLAHKWSNSAQSRFTIVHDDLKILLHEKARIMKLSDPNLKEAEITHYGKTQKYPLQISEIRSVASDSLHSVQLADFLAGAANHALNTIAKGEKPTTVEVEIRKLLFDKGIICGGLWPDKEVTPEGLEAHGEYGINPIDYTNRILSNDPDVYK